MRVIAALRSVIYATGFVAVWAWLAFQVRALDAVLGVGLPAGVRWAGLTIGGAGAALACWCIGAFVVVGRGTPAPFDAPRTLVVVGPYRWVRNPMYVGGLGMLLGLGLWLRSPAVTVFTGAGWLVAHLFVVLYEEPALTRLFGDQYREYCRRVGRWGIPTQTSGRSQR